MNHVRNLDSGRIGINFALICWVKTTNDKQYPQYRCFEIQFCGGSFMYLTTGLQDGRDFESAWMEFSNQSQQNERIAAIQ